MRNVLILIAAIAACGPSATEVKTAKTATYHADIQQVLQLAMEAAKETYKIADTNDGEHAFITEARFYSAEGDLESPGAGGFVSMTPGSVQVAFIVQVVPSENQGDVGVVVIPKTFQQVPGSPKPRELAPDDPALPGWVHGRVDSLSMAIYERCKGLINAAPGQSAPHG
jgi:hypothetical protein